MASTSHKEKLDDVEAQDPLVDTAPSPPASPAMATEYRVSTWAKMGHLALYFLCNVCLTLYNKMILGTFKYPWLLTAIHAGSASLGCHCLLKAGYFATTRLEPQQDLLLFFFSILFSSNIATSNLSLAMVSIPFHQIMRSTCPFFAVLIYRLRYNRTYSRETYLSLVPLVVGAGFATYGDYYFTTAGLVLTLLGVVLAVVKTIATNRIMTGPLALSPLETLYRMSPLAFLQALFAAWATGEIAAFRADDANYGTHTSSRGLLVLAGNGLLAFMLNVSSFSTNRVAGALTMTVCANMKQCLTVLLGIVLFRVRVDALNGMGMGMALAGAAWYSVVELRGKRKGNGLI